MQAAVVIATFAYNAAMRDELLPASPCRRSRRRPPRPALRRSRAQRARSPRRRPARRRGRALTGEDPLLETVRVWDADDGRGPARGPGRPRRRAHLPCARLPGGGASGTSSGPSGRRGPQHRAEPGRRRGGMLVEGLGGTGRRAPRRAGGDPPCARETVYVEPLGGDVVSAQVYRRRKGNHAGKPSGRYRNGRSGAGLPLRLEIYEEPLPRHGRLGRNPLTFG